MQTDCVGRSCFNTIIKKQDGLVKFGKGGDTVLTTGVFVGGDKDVFGCEFDGASFREFLKLLKRVGHKLKLLTTGFGTKSHCGYEMNEDNETCV